MPADAITLWSRRVAQLKEAFDSSFASPARQAFTEVERVLLLTVGGTPCIVPVGDCAGVVPVAALVPLPSDHHAFRGLTTVRGAVVPVYDLAPLLGLDSQPRTRPWLVLAAGPHPVGFLVESIDGYAGVADLPAGDHAAVKVLTVEGIARRLVALGPILQSIGAAHA